MDWTRRDFLVTVGTTASGLTIVGCDAIIDAIRNRPMRRSIGTLANTDPVVETYRDAVAQMKSLPPSDPRSWQAQADIHQNFCPHGNWLFLPWHRAYLLHFERICQELTGEASFGLPYWNWATHPQIPVHFWGASSNPLVHPRSATSSSTPNATSVGATVVDGILNEANFELFGSGPLPLATNQRTQSWYGGLEGSPHNHVHGFVGGDMGTYQSPRDPVFWCHHNMIEACWVEWQFGRGHSNTNSPDWLDRVFTEFVDGLGTPVEAAADIGLLYPILSYQFDTFDLGLGNPSEDRIDQRNPRDDAGKREQEDAANRVEDSDIVFSEVYETTAPADAAIDLPAVVRIPVAADKLLQQLELDATAIVTITVDSVDAWQDFNARVFVNRPNATPDTAADDPGYLGTFGFFLHHMPKRGEAFELRLEATRVLQGVASDSPDAQVLTVVLVPTAGRTAAGSFRIVRTTIGIVAAQR